MSLSRELNTRLLTKRQQFIKRVFDILLSLIVAPVALFLTVVLGIMATIDTGKLGVFTQRRVGRDARLFTLYKIRTLKGTAHDDINTIKENETRLGSWLRHTKLDEVPQVFNVLFGSMSWVGPRPDIPGYADKLVGTDRIILKIRPGITGPATIKYKNEDDILLSESNPRQYNDEVIWPDKVLLNKEYINNWSLWSDIKYLITSVTG